MDTGNFFITHMQSAPLIHTMLQLQRPAVSKLQLQRPAFLEISVAPSYTLLHLTMRCLSFPLCCGP